MPINAQEFENTNIVPVPGKVTNFIFPGGESDHTEISEISYKLCELMDGITARENGLKSLPLPLDRSYFYFPDVEAFPETEDDPDPPVGLKIHLSIPWDNPNFLRVVENVALLCESKNLDGRTSAFKVRLPEWQESEKASGSPQGYKSVTIYPNYLGSEQTNVPETVRLVAGLKDILKNAGLTEQDSGNPLSISERQSAPHIFIRPGALVQSGVQYENVAKTEPFQTQLENNLSCPWTDPTLFVKLTNEAISRNEL